MRRQGGERVEGGVEHRPVADRRRHQPAGVDHGEHVAVLLEPVVVAHRPAEPGGGAPVDLAYVVVGRVVADRARTRCRARAGRCRVCPARGSASGARRAPGAVPPAGRDRRARCARPARPSDARRRARAGLERTASGQQDVGAAAPGEDRALDRGPVPVGGLDLEVCRRRLPRPGAPRGTRIAAGSELARDARASTSGAVRCISGAPRRAPRRWPTAAASTATAASSDPGRQDQGASGRWRRAARLSRVVGLIRPGGSARDRYARPGRSRSRRGAEALELGLRAELDAGAPAPAGAIAR